MLKIISVSLFSIGLATSAFAQTASPSSDNKVNPGAMHAPQKTDDTVTNSTRTNCAPNLDTKGSSTTPNPTGSANVQNGEAGTNTNGQSSNC